MHGFALHILATGFLVSASAAAADECVPSPKVINETTSSPSFAAAYVLTNRYGMHRL